MKGMSRKVTGRAPDGAIPSFDAADQALQVFGFGAGRRHRVVRRLAAALQDADAAPGARLDRSQHRYERLAGHASRAGARHQDPTGANAADRELVEARIALERLCYSAPRAREAGRIEHDQVI